MYIKVFSRELLLVEGDTKVGNLFRSEDWRANSLGKHFEL